MLSINQLNNRMPLAFTCFIVVLGCLLSIELSWLVVFPADAVFKFLAQLPLPVILLSVVVLFPLMRFALAFLMAYLLFTRYLIFAKMTLGINLTRAVILIALSIAYLFVFYILAVAFVSANPSPDNTLSALGFYSVLFVVFAISMFRQIDGRSAERDGHIA